MTTISDIGQPGLARPSPQETGNTRRNHKPNRHAAETGDGVKQTAASAQVNTETADPKAQGVLRLLQEGHFQSVADARLRINFAEEITALQNTATRNTAEVGSEQLVARADAEISAFLVLHTLDDEATQEIIVAQDTLETAVQAAREALAETNPPDIFQFISDLQAAVDDFLATVGDILGIVPIAMTETSVEGDTGAPEDATAPAGPATTLALSPVEEFVSSLTDSLNSVIEELDQALQNISALPPLSEPKGNGVAFDKFVAALTDGAASPETGEATESFDIIA